MFRSRMFFRAGVAAGVAATAAAYAKAIDVADRATQRTDNTPSTIPITSEGVPIGGVYRRIAAPKKTAGGGEVTQSTSANDVVSSTPAP